MMVITTSAGLAIIIITLTACTYLHLHACFNIYIYAWSYHKAFLDHSNYGFKYLVMRFCLFLILFV